MNNSMIRCKRESAELDSRFTEAVTGWYRKNKRDLPWRLDKDPYHVWVSEIMLQQTRVEAVREYYLRWMDALPTVGALAEAGEEQLLKLWQGLGYYNRVRNLQKAARDIQQNMDGRFPSDPEGIRGLKGIGEYTAGAIGSICFDLQTPAVDGNVLRVMSRLTADYGDIKSAAMKKKITRQLETLYPERDCGDFTQGLIELGALVCVPNGKPNCDVCPVQAWCQAREQNIQMELPVKAEKKKRREEVRTVFVLTCGDFGKTEDGKDCGGRVAVCRRPKTGLLADLYEYPNLLEELTADQALRQADEWGCRPTGLTRSVKYKHIFSHVEWDMTAYYITCAVCGGPENRDSGQEARKEAGIFRWVTASQLEEEVPLPSAFAPFSV